jgi:hypothetical protein
MMYEVCGAFKVCFPHILILCTDHFILHTHTCHRTRINVFNQHSVFVVLQSVKVAIEAVNPVCHDFIIFCLNPGI